ncbi:acetyltransferase [Prauserella muralis]|uniref:Acetyltransferase n=1 Tax=Prauserella muralis TaxID=588067 RepID=A0A2V4BF61_9PSEU|nr:acetyltransferase [Prauserella muralis]
MAEPVVVREAVVADLSAITGIYAHYVTASVATFELEPPDEAEWRRRFAGITGAGLPFLVSEQEGRVAGYAYCSPWKPRPAYRQTVEDSIYLAPSALGRGLGGRLLDGLLGRCSALGIREVIAVVADSGDPASAALHRRRGFTDAGRLRRVGFKHGRWLDTVLLQRSL